MPTTNLEPIEHTRSIRSLEARFESAMRDLFDSLPPARRGELFKEILLEDSDGGSPGAGRPTGPPEWEEAIAAYDATRTRANSEEDWHEGQSLEYEDAPVIDRVARPGVEGAVVVHGKVDTDEELNEGQSLEYEDAPVLDALALCGNNTGRAGRREYSPSTESYDDQENGTSDGGYARTALDDDDSDVEMAARFTRESTAASVPESCATDDYTSDIYHLRRHSLAGPTLFAAPNKAPAGNQFRAEHARECRTAHPGSQPRARSVPATASRTPAAPAPAAVRAPAGHPDPAAPWPYNGSAGGGPCLYADCHAVFTNRRARVDHMDRAHTRTDTPLFACPGCGRHYVSFKTLRVHRRARRPPCFALLRESVDAAAHLVPGRTLHPWTRDVRGLVPPHPDDPLREMFLKAHPRKEDSALAAEEWDRFCYRRKKPRRRRGDANKY